MYSLNINLNGIFLTQIHYSVRLSPVAEPLIAK